MLAKGFEVETELAIQTIDKGFVQRDVDITFRSRPEGSFSKLNTFTDGFRVIRVIITVVKDFKPMLFFSADRADFFPVLDGRGGVPDPGLPADPVRYACAAGDPGDGPGPAGGAVRWCAGSSWTPIVRYDREQFFLRMRDFKDAPRCEGVWSDGHRPALDDCGRFCIAFRAAPVVT